jgi:acyl carrier protein
VIGVPAETILETSTPESLAGWDSLAHVHLITALEAEFGLEFSIDEALGLTSVAAILTALAERGAPR